MRITRLLSILVLTLVLSACRSTPVHNVDNGIVPAGQNLETTGKLITHALKYKRWSVLSDEPGKIIAHINVRKHSATIEIEFDKKNYSIKHVKSSQLKYDAGNQTIHRNYNNWIIYLENEIAYYFSNPDAANFRRN